MQHLTFRLSTYVAADERFRVDRKRLAPGPGVLHDHDYHELFWIESGRATHLVNGEERLLGSRRCVFVRPGDRHRLEPAGEAPCRLVNLMFASETAAHLASRYRTRLAERFFWSDTPLPLTRALGTDEHDVLTRLIGELEAGARELARLEGFLLALFTQVLDETPDLPSDLPPTLPPWLARACRAAREPVVFRAGASGLVAAAGKSHEHVCRAARRHLGLSPSAYVNTRRMEHAARLLAGSDESITQVALDCGLDNPSHFYRLFRERFGTTPKVYRQRHRRSPV